MSEKQTTDNRANPRENPAEDRNRAAAARSFLGLVLCALGLLMALFGFVSPFVFGPAASADISLQAVGAVLGIVGIFLGVRKLGAATLALCVLSAFFSLAASQGIVPGFQETDRDLHAVEPAADSPSGEAGETGE